MKAVLHQRLIVATGFCILISLASVLLFVSCGRTHRTGTTTAVGAGSRPALQTDGARAGLEPAPTIPLADALAQIDAYQPPKGVDAARFATLKAELKKLLTERAVGSKTISIAPVDPINAVTDLAATYNAGGTKVTLTWTEKLPGDYNNDGEVGIDDLVPLVLYYGQRTDTGANDAHRLVDGDGTPDIDIGDLQAIATNYGAHIQGYVMERMFDGDQSGLQGKICSNPNPANPAWSADRPYPPPSSARPTYTYVDDITDLPAENGLLLYAIAPCGDGAYGVVSNGSCLSFPPVYSVSGTVTVAGTGLDGVTVTLTPGGRSAVTQSDGTFTIAAVLNGGYTLIPLKAGYTFTPASRSVTMATADVKGLDFTATSSAHSVFGTVTSSGVGLPGVTLSLAPDGQNATTQADGTYAITNVASGTYRLTPYKMGYALTPSYRTVSVAASDVNGQDFDGEIASGLADSAWPKLHSDSRNTGLSPHVGAQTNAVMWWFAPDFEGTSPVIGVDGTLYMGGGKAHAFNPVDGTVKWASSTKWVMKCPTITLDGTLYAGSTDCNVYALSPVDGSVIWSQETMGNVGDSPAIGVDGTLYVGYVTGICALNPSDGSVKWAHPTYYLMSGSPAIGGDGTVYVGSSNDISAFNPSDGSVRWTYRTGDMVRSSPAIGPDGTLYVGSDDKNVYALNPADGTVKWMYATGGVVTSSPAIGPDGTLYVGSDDKNVYALNPTDGSVKWMYATGDYVRNSPAIGADGIVYVGSDKMYALNPADGTVKWSYATGGTVSHSPAIGPDGTVYVTSYDGRLYAFGP